MAASDTLDAKYFQMFKFGEKPPNLVVVNIKKLDG